MSDHCEITESQLEEFARLAGYANVGPHRTRAEHCGEVAFRQRVLPRVAEIIAALRAARDENAALREWKEQAAPTLKAMIAREKRVREALARLDIGSGGIMSEDRRDERQHVIGRVEEALSEERAENGRLTTEMNRLRLRFPEIVIEEALGLEEPSHE